MYFTKKKILAKYSYTGRFYNTGGKNNLCLLFCSISSFLPVFSYFSYIVKIIFLDKEAVLFWKAKYQRTEQNFCFLYNQHECFAFVVCSALYVISPMCLSESVIFFFHYCVYLIVLITIIRLFFYFNS